MQLAVHLQLLYSEIRSSAAVPAICMIKTELWSCLSGLWSPHKALKVSSICVLLFWSMWMRVAVQFTISAFRGSRGSVYQGRQEEIETRGVRGLAHRSRLGAWNYEKESPVHRGIVSCSGKSSLINAFLGLRNSDKGAARWSRGNPVETLAHHCLFSMTSPVQAPWIFQ